jgi:hypothetical protein
MASAAVGSPALSKHVVESSTPEQDGKSRDVEVGYEPVDLDRIEKVYSYVLQTPPSANDQGLIRAASLIAASCQPSGFSTSCARQSGPMLDLHRR